MLRPLFHLAFQGTLRKKRSSILIFIVLLISFSCAILSLSVTKSISDTNAEYRYNTYGEWYLALSSGKDEDLDWLSRQAWATSIGCTRSYGSIPGVFGSFGTVDADYLSMGRASLKEGRLPQAFNEIALTEEILSKAGYSEYTIGMQVLVTVSNFCSVPVEGGTSKPVGIESSGVATQTLFTLCGVLNDFNSLWSLQPNRNVNKPVAAIVTQETAEAVLQRADEFIRKNYPGYIAPTPVQQYYISVERENHTEAVKQTQAYLRDTRDILTEDTNPCVNYAAYPVEMDTTPPDTLYSFLIAAVALTAVLCVHMMCLSTEVHSFSVLRSLGITRAQLLTLTMLEGLLLAVPAVALGIPLGVLLTKLALRLLLYSGSVPVQAGVPTESLKLLLVLWLAVIVLARLIVFAVTVRTPLTGRMQLQEQKARSARRLRSVLTVLLLAAFGTAVTYTISTSLQPLYVRDLYLRSAAYRINGRDALIPDELAEKVGRVPGVEHVEGYAQLSINVAFDGLDECGVTLFVLDEAYREDTLQLGENAQAFHDGELVLLCFPSWSETALFPSDGTVQLRAYTGYRCAAELSTPVLIWQQPAYMQRSTDFYIVQDYTVVCSAGFMQKLTDALEPGDYWGKYSADGEFGHDTLLVMADELAGELSADLVLEQLAKENGFSFSNSREKNQLELQATTQELVQLYACGGCAALVTLLLLAGALTLEAEQEKRRYAILRIIGMSRRQLRRRVAGKALRRSLFAALFGWACYAVIATRTSMGTQGVGVREGAEVALRVFRSGGGSWTLVAALSAALLLVLMLVTLLTKRGLGKSSLPARD